MDQLESLRELSIAQPEYIYIKNSKKRRRRKYALVVLPNGESSKF
jgi:hypothetical protein